MADDVVYSFLITMVAGLALVIPIIAFLFLYRRLPLPIWRIFRLELYRLKPGEKYDAAEGPRWSQVRHHSTRKMWKLYEKGIVWFWVETALFRGFWLDYKFKPCITEVEGQATLRLLEKVPNVFESNNFVPLDYPSELRRDKFEADMSAAALEVKQTAEMEMTRGDTENWWRDIAIPLGGLFFLLLFAFIFYLHADNQSKIAADSYVAQSSHLATIEAQRNLLDCAILKRQYNIDCATLFAQNQTNQSAPPGPLGIG